MVPDYTTTTALTGPMWVEIDSALSVDIDPDGYEAELGSSSDEPVLSGVRINLTDWGLGLDGVDGEVLAGWYLGAYNAQVAPSWPVQINDLSGVSPGESLHLYAASYPDLGWVSAGTATVNDAGQVTSDSGAGLSVLLSLIHISEPTRPY